MAFQGGFGQAMVCSNRVLEGASANGGSARTGTGWGWDIGPRVARGSRSGALPNGPCSSAVGHVRGSVLTYVRTEEVSFWPCQHSLSVVPENPPGLQNLDPRFRAILGCGCHQPRSLSWRSCQARAQKATPPPPPHLRKQLQPHTPRNNSHHCYSVNSNSGEKKKRERER
jgi:hypothetical protein